MAFDANGIEKIEFLIAPNLGEGFKPLVKIASGGETSRLMLALKNVLAGADQIPTLIFDEIDQGIGGRIGGVVGRKLWGLTFDERQRTNDENPSSVVLRPYDQGPLLPASSHWPKTDNRLKKSFSSSGSRL